MTTQPANPATSQHTQPIARGFALYVGIDATQAAEHGTSLSQIAAALRKTLEELVPGSGSQTHAAVALAPKESGGRNIDVVRAALRDPELSAKVPSIDTEKQTGIVVDTQRRRVLANGENAGLTHREFELIKYLIDNQGETISRRELIESVWADDIDAAPNDRTIDVHIRRLRAKIGGYEDIIRTIRGGGYRFDRHPDVLVDSYQI
jgi:DNA-binding winged helix-turn-helix (wHTH) protein